MHDAEMADAVSVYEPAGIPVSSCVAVTTVEYPLGPVTVTLAGTVPGSPFTCTVRAVPADT